MKKTLKMFKLLLDKTITEMYCKQLQSTHNKMGVHISILKYNCAKKCGNLYKGVNNEKQTQYLIQ